MNEDKILETLTQQLIEIEKRMSIFDEGNRKIRELDEDIEVKERYIRNTKDKRDLSVSLFSLATVQVLMMATTDNLFPSTFIEALFSSVTVVEILFGIKNYTSLPSTQKLKIKLFKRMIQDEEKQKLVIMERYGLSKEKIDELNYQRNEVVKSIKNVLDEIAAEKIAREKRLEVFNRSFLNNYEEPRQEQEGLSGYQKVIKPNLHIRVK